MTGREASLVASESEGKPHRRLLLSRNMLTMADNHDGKLDRQGLCEVGLRASIVEVRYSLVRTIERSSGARSETDFSQRLH